MINIDSRLLDQVEADELYLLSRLANRMNRDGVCWPGNTLLMKECGWSKAKLIRIKKRLYKKGLLSASTRQKNNSAELMSNLYKLETNLITNFTGSVNSDTTYENNTTHTQDGNHMRLNPDTGYDQNKDGVVSESSREVLTSEELNNEELNNEELNKEKKHLSFVKSYIFEDLIETFWPDLVDHKHFYSYEFILPRESQEINATIKNLLVRVARAADEIYDVFDSLKRSKIRFRNRQILREDAHKSGSDNFKEYRYQANAYVDFCRLSKTHMTATPEKIATKLIEKDWVIALFDYTKDDIETWKYDPAMDEDELLSTWLIEMYYTGVYMGYVCDRYNNRIVYAGEEYLTRRK
jgi:hypothetical protein